MSTVTSRPRAANPLSLPIVQSAASAASEGGSAAGPAVTRDATTSDAGHAVAQRPRKDKLKVGLVAYNWEVDTSLALWYLELYANRDPLIASSVSMAHYCAATPKTARQEQTEHFKLVRWVLEGNFDIVGFSCYIWNIQFVNKVAAVIKELRPEITIVYGGQQIRGFYVDDVFQRKQCVDICVVNEGEVTFQKVLLHYLSGQPALEEIPGIAFRKPTGEVQHTGNCEIVDELNELPSPYLGDVQLRDGAGYLYEGSRGCPYRCSFCIWGESKGVREYDMERVERELEEILRHHPSHIMFCDGTFNMRKERARRILEILRDHLRDGRVEPFSLLLELKLEIIDVPTADVIDELLQLNPLMTVEFGLQSATQSAAKLMRRPFSEARYREAWERLSPRTRSMAIVDCIYGLPGDGMEEFKYTVDFAYSLSPHRVQCFRLSILPGCEFERQAEEFEIKFSREPGHFVHQTKWVSYEEMLWLEAFGFAVCDLYHFHGHTVRSLLGQTGLQFSRLIADFVNHVGRDVILNCLGEGERPEGRWRAINLSQPFSEYVLNHLCRTSGFDDATRSRLAVLLRYETILGATAVVEGHDAEGESSKLHQILAAGPPSATAWQSLRGVYLKSTAQTIHSEYDIPLYIAQTRGHERADVGTLATNPCHLAIWSRGGSAASGVAFPVSCKLSARMAQILAAFAEPRQIGDVFEPAEEGDRWDTHPLSALGKLIKNGLLCEVRPPQHLEAEQAPRLAPACAAV